jgi:hypothetical protein
MNKKSLQNTVSTLADSFTAGHAVEVMLDPSYSAVRDAISKSKGDYEEYFYIRGGYARKDVELYAAMEALNITEKEAEIWVNIGKMESVLEKIMEKCFGCAFCCDRARTVVSHYAKFAKDGILPVWPSVRSYNTPPIGDPELWMDMAKGALVVDQGNIFLLLPPLMKVLNLLEEAKHQPTTEGR